MADVSTTSIIDRKAEEALSRIEASRTIAETLTGNADLEAMDLAALVRELAENLDQNLGSQVRTDIPDEAMVRANDGIRSVIDNLLENAHEHNDAEEPRISVAVEREPNTVTVVVGDNGPGLPPPARETLLGHTPSTEADGLSLVRTLLEAYDGEIRLEDNTPRGTEIRVTLPRTRGDQRSR